MSKVEVDHLRNSIGNLISMNSFLSTSLDRDVALRFLQSNGSMIGSDDFEPVLFEIQGDPQIISNKMMTMNTNCKPFAKISQFSDIGDECEVLFMLGSIFCLNQICHDQSLAHARMSIIRMTLSSDHDNDLKELYDHMKNEYDREETNLLSLGDVMLKMGKFDLAEKYYRRLLSELPSNDPSLSDLYQRLGRVANAKGEYDTSLEWYEKSLRIDVRTRPSDHVNIGLTHNNIGNVHRKKGDHSRALESYNRAVSLFQQAHDDNHPDMASFYNNIGIIYDEQQKYVEALDFYEKSLAIWKKHLPSDHPDLGRLYNNIGAVHRCLGHCDVALKHYNRSLEIKMKSLPAQHPTIATTYENMGLVYEDKGELEQALILLEKACTIFKSSLSNDHSDVVRIKKVVQRVKDKLNKSGVRVRVKINK
jgi:tetratricopeptide (TPR) repeat protein